MGKLDKVLKLRSQGKKYKEIAEILSCNISLVSYYLNHENNLKKFELKRQDESLKKKKECC